MSCLYMLGYKSIVQLALGIHGWFQQPYQHKASNSRSKTICFVQEKSTNQTLEGNEISCFVKMRRCCQFASQRGVDSHPASTEMCSSMHLDCIAAMRSVVQHSGFAMQHLMDKAGQHPASSGKKLCQTFTMRLASAFWPWC